MIFKDEPHKVIYNRLINRCRRVDDETKSILYLLALASTVSNQAESLFDFDDMSINPENFHAGWQTSGTFAATRLAFTLWNGFPSEDDQSLNNVCNIFGTGWDKYFIQAIQLRFNIPVPSEKKNDEISHETHDVFKISVPELELLQNNASFEFKFRLRSENNREYAVIGIPKEDKAEFYALMESMNRRQDINIRK